jgi:very-short-patch-repair endonuclease
MKRFCGAFLETGRWMVCNSGDNIHMDFKFLDFYCFKANLVIEIDGLTHLGHVDYDIERTRYLESSGLNVIRFTNEDIEKK